MFDLRMSMNAAAGQDLPSSDSYSEEAVVLHEVDVSKAPAPSAWPTGRASD